MSTSVITMRTVLTSDWGRTLLVLEFQLQRLRLTIGLSPYHDSVVCTTAIQSRPNNFRLRVRFFRCQD